MKNAVYAGIIAVCILGAVLVFLLRGSGSTKTPDQPILVKCAKCNQSYEMSQKAYFKELEEKARAGNSPIMRTLPLTCQKCGQEGVFKALKCPNCGEVFFENSVPRDYPDRCPKCKHSATEDNRNANKARQGQ
jgi:predicted Zn-ribbon and HTH transcriptional regulator